ncbi:exonuclease domain-containing protein [Chitinophagaceae bacterium LB-8]|uniref:Exonuclease domain-containing protein n=1 Tax=Paraflavisolibacter caeni TaxID=2982496 RepID=A0A9X2XSQ9_9BACT|nr:exonuclease domain-containing protein [Paraflavisolibacter caeni]MCU7548231.1 exonuclease domain-containing protein [Paraflavisolibacter caeni]
MYAIVDIETTGGYAAANGIIEIAIRIFDGEKVTEEFETLINPNQTIPKYIQAFTGISNEMVQDAPQFEEVAQQVFTLLQGNIFVAHNVNFDYSFVKSHLEHYGYGFHEKKLCTVRLSRQIFPGLPSYSLGNLCQSLEIEINNRHRAGGDAGATTVLFQKLLANDKANAIGASLLRNSKEQILPPNVPKQHFTQLPSTPGVYYFHDQKGKVVYVGKAKNIKKRVNSHFSNNSDSRQRQNFLRNVYSISYKECATELMASILEAAEIKRLWPLFNQAQKVQDEIYGIYVYEDQNGYQRLVIDKKRRHSQPICSFHYKVDVHNFLKKLITKFELCPRLCYVQTDNEKCIGIVENYCHGACEHQEPASTYNIRVGEALASLKERPSYIVFDKGLQENQLSCVVVEQGTLFGMGYIDHTMKDHSIELLKEQLQPLKDNASIRQILHRYAEQNAHKITFVSYNG